MHRLTKALRARRRRRLDERGAVAVIVAVCLTALVLGSAMVLDFGLVRIDRQVNKSAADAAATAGLYGLKAANGDAHPFVGVCTAMRFLQKNDPRFAGIDTSGTWSNASSPSTTTANGCTDSALQNQVCDAGNVSTWARYTWNGSYQGQALQVVVQSGYRLTDSEGQSFPEESLPAVAADNVDEADGCDQLAVTITENRKPALGSVARSADLVSTIRTVGRVKGAPGGDAPAMLLLKRTGCPVLSVGAVGGGASSYVHVFGAVSSTGRAQAGSIHSDSDGSGCSGGVGNQIFLGKAADGIVAYAAPQASNPALADPAKPGQITSRAGAIGVGIGTIRDADANVYGSGAVNPTGAATAAKNRPTGRSLVTRKLVDERYLGLATATTPETGVTAAVKTATNNVFSLTATTAQAAGWTVVPGCPATLPALTATDRLFVDCTANTGFTGSGSTNARSVFFNGKVNPSGTLSLPNADHVYIAGSSTNAIDLSTGGGFSMHTAGNLSGTTCSNAFTASKAVLFVKNGSLKQTGGLLQLCNTTMFLMGGQAAGCLPTTNGTAPTASPCGTGGMGTGQLTQNGGDVDWTAPNRYDVMTTAEGDPDPLVAPAWTDVNGPEDLALWSESAGNNTSTTYSMSGGGLFHVKGVFMVPNADSFSIGGGASQNLTNAQYIASTIALVGATQLSMTVDPNSAVTLPRLKLVGLVR